MNDKSKLEALMKLHGDTGTSLADCLGIARTTFSAKLNETNGAQFTQSEIAKIKKRYGLNAEQLDEVFFDKTPIKGGHMKHWNINYSVLYKNAVLKEKLIVNLEAEDIQAALNEVTKNITDPLSRDPEVEKVVIWNVGIVEEDVF